MMDFWRSYTWWRTLNVVYWNPKNCLLSRRKHILQRNCLGSVLKLRAMKYESPYQPWRADESWSLTLVGVLASHRFGSLQKPEKRHATSRIFGLLDTGYYWIYPSSPEIQWFIFPNVHGMGKTGSILPLEKSGKKHNQMPLRCPQMWKCPTFYHGFV